MLLSSRCCFLLGILSTPSLLIWAAAMKSAIHLPDSHVLRWTGAKGEQPFAVPECTASFSMARRIWWRHTNGNSRPRGINFLKGKLVTQAPAASKASAEDERALVQLLDNPQKFEKKEARCISVLGVEILLETLCFLFFFVITDPPETSFLCPDVRCPFSSGGGQTLRWPTCMEIQCLNSRFRSTMSRRMAGRRKASMSSKFQRCQRLPNQLPHQCNRLRLWRLRPKNGRDQTLNSLRRRQTRHPRNAKFLVASRFAPRDVFAAGAPRPEGSKRPPLPSVLGALQESLGAPAHWRSHVGFRCIAKSQSHDRSQARARGSFQLTRQIKRRCWAVLEKIFKQIPRFGEVHWTGLLIRLLGSLLPM